MKRFFIAVVAIVMGVSALQSQITVIVTGNTNTSPALFASYPSLKDALDSLNKVTAMTGPVAFSCSGSETVAPTGLLLGSSTLNPVLNSTNTITITGPATINAGIGTATPSSAIPDGMFAIMGADHVTLDGLTFTDGNAANPATMEFGIAMFKRNAGDGANNNTIQNCIFNMQRINNASSTSPMVEGAVAILLINSTPTTATTPLTPTNGGTLSLNGTNSGNKIYGNQINGGNYGIAFSGFAATAGVGPNPNASTFLGDLGNDIGGLSIATGNTVLNYGGAASATNPSAGIRTNNQWSINISYNTLNNNNGSGVNHVSTFRGIFAQAGTSANATISNNNLTIQSGALTSACNAIDNGIGSTASSNTVNITNNIVNFAYNSATSGVSIGINNSATAAIVNINNNTINGISGTFLAGTGTHILIETGSPATANVNNNILQNFQRNGASGSWRGIKTTSPTNLIISGNTVDNLSWTNLTSTGAIDGIYGLSSAVNVTITNNTVKNLSAPTTGSINGIREFGVSGTKLIQNNQVFNLNTTSGGAGGGTYSGIFLSTGIITVSNNKVYDITSIGANGAVVGLNISGGTGPHNIFNNYIGNLFTPASTGINAIRGIELGNSSANNIYFNTVYLNATSSSVTTFGSSCLLFNTSQTSVDLRNNILVNLSTPAQEGLNISTNGVAAVVRRASGTTGVVPTNYATTSDRNMYWVNPTLGTNNHLTYVEGTTTITNPKNTVSDLRTFMVNRDQNSVQENPPFLSTMGSSPQYLHINTTIPTQLESAASPIGSVLTDYDGETRNVSTPDIGADEFNGIPSPPMTYVSSTVTQTNTSATSINSINQQIIGIQIVTTGETSPLSVSNFILNTNGTTNTSDIVNAKLWYTGTSPIFATTNQYGSTFNSPNGAFNISGTATLSSGTNYFWLTYDFNCSSNVNNVVDAECSQIRIGPFQTPTVTAPAGNRTLYDGLLNSVYTVGSGGNYPTLESAINDVNNIGLSANTTFEILNNLTVTSQIVINQWTECGVGGYILTIRPSASTSPIISGNISGLSLIKINGASRVVIDGSNNGSNSRNLTLENISITTPNVIVIGSIGSNSINNVTLKNTILINGVQTSSGILIGDATTPGNAGNFNNISILNNIVQKAYIGIYSRANVLAGNGSGLLIRDNDFTSAGALALRYIGIYVEGVDGATVTNNNLANFETTSSEDDKGIWLATGTKNSIVSKNRIYNLNYSGTGGYGGHGVYVSSGVTGSNIEISNNFINNLTGDGWNYTGSAVLDNPIGIVLTGTQTGINVYYNTINLYGNTLNQTSAMSMGMYLGAGSVADIRNNIIKNNCGLLSATGYGSVGIYAVTNNAQFANINYNVYYANATGSGVKFIGQIASTGQTTLAGWQGATAQDINSKNVEPIFISTSDIHLDPTNPSNISNINAMATVLAVTTDIDNEIRDVTTPDIGADEFFVISCSGTPVAGVISPNSSSRCVGETYQMTATGLTSGLGISYQWKVASNSGGPYTNVLDGVGATTANYTTGILTLGTYYYVIETTCSNGGGSSISNELTLTVNGLPSVAISPIGPTTICSPNFQTFTATSDIGDSYQWKRNNSNIPSANNFNYNATLAGNYKVIVSVASTGCLDSSSVSILIVNPQPGSPMASASPDNVCTGADVSLFSSAILPGYSINIAGTESFIDIAGTGTSIVGFDDDTEHNISMQPFVFNGITYNNARIGTNGALALGSSSLEITNTNAALPTTANTAGNILLLPFWDDLDTIGASSIKLDTVGSKYIIQYTNLAHYSLSGPIGAITFQIQLDNSNNKIHFVYQDVDFNDVAYNFGVSATVGIQFSSSSALQHSFNTTSVGNGQCITFAPNSVNYTWSGPNSFSSNLQNPTLINVDSDNSGTYQVIFNNPITSCTDTASVQISITGDTVMNGNNTGAESLRKVMECANATDTIYFDAGVTMVNLTDTLLVNKNLTFQGNGGSPMISFNLSSINEGVIVPVTVDSVTFNDISIKNQLNAIPLISNDGYLKINNSILKGTAIVPEIRNKGVGVINIDGLTDIKIE